MNEKLKYCPFCGKEGIFVKIMRNKWTVSCKNQLCSVRPGTRINTKKEVVKAWNKRVKNE
jgi:transcription elongation factor Elf1